MTRNGEGERVGCLERCKEETCCFEKANAHARTAVTHALSLPLKPSACAVCSVLFGVGGAWGKRGLNNPTSSFSLSLSCIRFPTAHRRRQVLRAQLSAHIVDSRIQLCDLVREVLLRFLRRSGVLL